MISQNGSALSNELFAEKILIRVIHFRLPVVWSEGAQSGQLYVVLLLLALPSLSADRAKPTALHQQSSSNSTNSQLAYK